MSERKVGFIFGPRSAWHMRSTRALLRINLCTLHLVYFLTIMGHETLKFPMRTLISTLGLHVYKCYLHWVPKSINITYIGLFGALGVYFPRNSIIRTANFSRGCRRQTPQCCNETPMYCELRGSWWPHGELLA